MNEQEMDAVTLLTTQHRRIETLLQQIADADDAERKELFVRAADELTVHIKSEEEIFYPAVHRARTEDELLESLEEHLSLKRLLADLTEMDPAEKSFEPKFKVLKEQTEHHHQEEEQNLFPTVLQLFDTAALQQLTQEMLARQAELTQLGQPRAAMSNETASAAPLQ